MKNKVKNMIKYSRQRKEKQISVNIKKILKFSEIYKFKNKNKFDNAEPTYESK